MLKNDLKEKLSEKEILQSCKWRNVYFSKEGKAYRGNILWETIELAKARVKEILSYPSEEFILQTQDGELKKRDWAWTIQIPVLTQ